MAEKEIICEEMIEVYTYGINTIFSFFISFLSIISIGALFNQFFECAVLFLSFSCLRKFTGGYHAKTSQRCFVLSMATIILNMILLKFIPINMMRILSPLFSVLSMITIFCLTPIDNINKQIDKIQHKAFRRISIGIASALVCITFILIFINQTKWSFVISQAMLLDAIMLLIVKVNKLKGKMIPMVH